MRALTLEICAGAESPADGMSAGTEKWISARPVGGSAISAISILRWAEGGHGRYWHILHIAFPPACPQPDIAALDAKSWFHRTRTYGLSSLSTTRPVTEICWGLLVPLRANAQQQVRSSKRCGKQHSEHQPSSELRGMLWEVGSRCTSGKREALRPLRMLFLFTSCSAPRSQDTGVSRGEAR